MNYFIDERKHLCSQWVSSGNLSVYLLNTILKICISWFLRVSGPFISSKSQRTSFKSERVCFRKRHFPFKTIHCRALPFICMHTLWEQCSSIKKILFHKRACLRDLWLKVMYFLKQKLDWVSFCTVKQIIVSYTPSFKLNDMVHIMYMPGHRDVFFYLSYYWSSHD